MEGDKPVEVSAKLNVGIAVDEESWRHGCFQLPRPFPQSRQPGLEGQEGILAYLSGAKKNTESAQRFTYVNQLTTKSDAAFEGDPDAFLASFKDQPEVYAGLQKQMKNKVRKCPNCGKPVAFTLPNCNQCDHDLTQVPISYTNNIFSSFVYGLSRGPFPLTVSLRSQTEDTLVFDDLLSLTVCHLNVIPTDCYLADWRYLLKRPREGKRLITRMFDACFDVLYTQFWSATPPLFRKTAETEKLTKEELKGLVACGFNYPPSQYQLHLQFMLPPFLPFQYYMYLRGKHFTYGRFFPLEYGLKALDKLIEIGEKEKGAEEGGEAGEVKGYAVTEDTPIEEIIAYFKGLGVDYDAIHAECYANYGKTHRLLSNWNRNDFEGVIIEPETIVTFGDATAETNGDKARKIQADDKTTLQNYGRPYTTPDNKPTGTYYAHAKKDPRSVIAW